MSTQETTATPSQKKAKASKKAKAARTKKATKTKRARSGSKAEKVLTLMKRKEGATLAEIAKATDWQNQGRLQSVRFTYIPALTRITP